MKQITNYKRRLSLALNLCVVRFKKCWCWLHWKKLPTKYFGATLGTYDQYKCSKCGRAEVDFSHNYNYW